MSTDTDTRRDPSLPLPKADTAGWSDIDVRAVDTVRVLAADAVQKTGNGHPGTAMSLAPLAYLLYQQVMRVDPSDPEWIGRDRFVLSCGHSSLTQYIQLYYSGYGLELDDLKKLRTWGSKVPGHPEYHHTDGVDITTGPLGSGIASAVGMAMAQRRQRGMLDPDAAPGTSPFDHHIWTVASDGDMMEGVSGESASLAGTQELGNLIAFYDQNQISIEDDTDVSFGEDVAARYEAYGWHVQTVDWRLGASSKGDGDYVEDVDALLAAIEAAKAVTDRPSFIALKTILAWPAPNKKGTGKAHGSALGDEEVAGTKKLLGFDPEQTFEVSDEVISHVRKAKDRGAQAHAEWQKGFESWRSANPDGAKLLDRLVAHELPEGFDAAFPTFDADAKGIASRAASGKVLTALADVMPELWGGSADLAESNNTTMDGQPSFIPANRQTEAWKGNPYGRTLHFGIRENAMGMALNGIALEGLTRPYGGTFLTFSDYMRPAVRLAALQRIPVTFVWTHDSVGLGEDGPTHQPIEHLAALRAIPDLAVVRPGDANETAAAWKAILTRRGPAALALSRQALPTLDRSEYASADGVDRGGYILADSEKATPDVVLIATGSEVSVAVAARKTLKEKGIDARVVSLPCREWFFDQDKAYRDQVLPPSVKARVSIEAATTFGWHDLVGDNGVAIGIDHYGESADGALLMEKFGFTSEHVVQAAQDVLNSL
ncbi:transketolase [Allobranchiibius sp. CTAmp26]|uniref:transketolase n=1 Tax=Allobranchiibius sp. CTAmp26 TaxID=2815214 RepID=UPI001AA0E838|nr:transketolase [Allobranchiibius sp. CTAmp26]MBO1754117.1 transketolase [Allobranchiibius sp. CTAmp26]